MRAFEEFRAAYPGPFDLGAERAWNRLSDQEQADAILFIGYGRSFFEGWLRPMPAASIWLLGWWHGIPPALQRKERQRLAEMADA